MIQRNRHAVSSISPSSRPRCRRRNAEDARDLGALVGAEEHRRARVGPKRVEHLRRRGTSRSASGPRRPRRRRGTRAPSRPTPSRPPRASRGRRARAPRSTRRYRTAAASANTPNSRAARDLGRVLDLEPEAKVRLVRAVAEVRLLPGHARERRLELDAAALAPDPRDDPLDQPEQLVLVGERHLDVELRQLLQPVGAQILVPEAAGDLVVALEAGDHEQLLVDLRALRQREEAARLQPRRDRKSRAPSGVGLPMIGVSMSTKPAASISWRMIETALCARPDVALQPVAAQVEPAVADPQRLVDAFLVELERERRRAARGSRARRPGPRPRPSPCAGSRSRARGAPPRRGRGRRTRCEARARPAAAALRPLRVDHELRDAALVAEVDEDRGRRGRAAARPSRRASPSAPRRRW